MMKNKQLLLIGGGILLFLMLGLVVYRLSTKPTEETMGSQPQVVETNAGKPGQDAASDTADWAILQPSEAWIVSSQKYQDFGGHDLKLETATSQRKSKKCENCKVAIYTFIDKNNQQHEIEVSVRPASGDEGDSVVGMDLLYPTDASKYYDFFFGKGR